MENKSNHVFCGQFPAKSSTANLMFHKRQKQHESTSK